MPQSGVRHLDLNQATCVDAPRLMPDGAGRGQTGPDGAGRDRITVRLPPAALLQASLHLADASPENDDRDRECD